MLKLNSNIAKLENLDQVDVRICEIERHIDQIGKMRGIVKESDLLAYLDEVQHMVDDTKLIMLEIR